MLLVNKYWYICLVSLFVFAFPSDAFAETKVLKFEWSPYQPGECADCTAFELHNEYGIIVNDIPITDTTIEIIVEITETDYVDYWLVARNTTQHSGKSDLARVSDDPIPEILKITQIR